MPVVHSYSDATNIKTVGNLTTIGFTRSSVSGVLLPSPRYSTTGVPLRLRKLTAVKVALPIDNSTGKMYTKPLLNRGSVFLSTFPPVYKTALGAEAGKVKTPRIHPPIYVNVKR